MASKIIAKERGAASKLVYRVKTAVEGLSRDLQSARRTGKLAKTLVRFCALSCVCRQRIADGTAWSACNDPLHRAHDAKSIGRASFDFNP